MSVYRFDDASPVKEVLFRYAKGRQTVALLVASENTSSEQLIHIRRAMESQGYQCVPAFAEGRDVLQVNGFSGEESLIQSLQQNHFVRGQRKEFITEQGDNPKLTLGDKVRRASLRLAGVLNTIGDVGLLTSGIRKRNYYTITGGGLYTVGGLNLALFGNAKPEHFLREVSERTVEALQKELGTLPEDTGLASVGRNKRTGVLAEAKNFLTRYPSQVTLGAYTAGAGAMLGAGVQKWNNSRGTEKREWGGIAYGASSLTMKLATLAIPEKSKTEQDEQPKKPLGAWGKLTNWVRQKPWRVFGFGSLITEVFLARDTYEDFVKDKKSGVMRQNYLFKAVATASYMLSDLLAAISNKDHTNADGKFTADEQRRVEALVAEVLARQPEPARDGLAQQVGAFLAKQEEVNGKEEDISASILQQAEHMKTNRWAARMTSAPELVASPGR